MDITPLKMRRTANKFEETQFRNDSNASSDSKSRLSVANGPAGSTSLHFWKTSQYLSKNKIK